MSDIYGQYGVFIDDTNWEYHGAWSNFYFDMKNMRCHKVSKDGTTEDLPIMILKDRIEVVGTNRTFGISVQAEYQRYLHWLFEKELLS